MSVEMQEKETIISSSASIASDARLLAPRVVVGPGVRVAPGVRIEAHKEIHLEEGTTVGMNTTIRAAEVRIGHGTRIGERCVIRGGKGRSAEEVRIGDFSLIDSDANILAKSFLVGDHVSIFKNFFVAGGRERCHIGHNSWIGQDTIFDTNERLTVGNNVRIGTGSRLWTHVASGELLEGCTLFGRHPLVVEDNVWIVGGATISPGLVLKDGSIIMVGAVLTKSTEVRHTYAGVPAKDTTEKMNFYREVSPSEKWKMLRSFLDEFADESEQSGYRVTRTEEVIRFESPDYSYDVILADHPDWSRLSAPKRDTVVFTPGSLPSIDHPRLTVFSLESKRYLKRRTPAERSVITFLNGYMARFLPASG
jgi:acetyltransferase-like isoleucine patch superfamily enzyme